MVHTLTVFVDCLSISALQALCTYLHASRLHVCVHWHNSTDLSVTPKPSPRRKISVITVTYFGGALLCWEAGFG